MLVATDARIRLARLHISPAAHGLHGDAPRVKGLEEERHAGRRVEVGRAVGFHRHGAQHELASGRRE